MVKYLQCGVFPRAQGHVEGSSDLVECTRSKHLHIQAADKNKMSSKTGNLTQIIYYIIREIHSKLQ